MQAGVVGSDSLASNCGTLDRIVLALASFSVETDQEATRAAADWR